MTMSKKQANELLELLNNIDKGVKVVNENGKRLQEFLDKQLDEAYGLRHGKKAEAKTTPRPGKN